VLLCDGNSQIREETILYAVIDVFAKGLGSRIFGQEGKSTTEGWKAGEGDGGRNY